MGGQDHCIAVSIWYLFLDTQSRWFCLCNLIITSINYGFYATELIGMGVNLVTGDYSMGASGMLIKNGEITHAVSEVTIASNLKEIFMNLSAANDLEFKYRSNAPTVLIETMTLAGK